MCLFFYRKPYLHFRNWFFWREGRREVIQFYFKWNCANIYFLWFNFFIFPLLPLCVLCLSMNAMSCMWRQEDNLGVSPLLPCRSWGGNLELWSRLGSKHLFLLSQLTGPHFLTVTTDTQGSAAKTLSKFTMLCGDHGKFQNMFITNIPPNSHPLSKHFLTQTLASIKLLSVAMKSTIPCISA